MNVRVNGLAVGSSQVLHMGADFCEIIQRENGGGGLTTIAGNWDPNAVPVFGDGLPPNFYQFGWLRGIAIDGGGNVYFGDAGASKIQMVDYTGLFSRQVRLEGSDLAYTDESGEVYLFDASGKHLKTRDALTGTSLLNFDYDSAGYLSAITDNRFGTSPLAVSIERDSSGRATAIEGPYGQRTELYINANQRLQSVQFADQTRYAFGYSSEGQITDKHDPRGNHWQYEYDSDGSFASSLNPAGGGITLARTLWPDANTVSATTAEGQVLTVHNEIEAVDAVSVENIKTIVDAAGDAYHSSVTPGGDAFSSVSPTGYSVEGTYTWEPNAGLPFLSTLAENLGIYARRSAFDLEVETNGGVTTVTRQATVHPGDPDEKTSVLVQTHDPAGASEIVMTSPEEREVVMHYDGSTLLTESVEVPGFFPVHAEYDADGRVERVYSVDPGNSAIRREVTTEYFGTGEESLPGYLNGYPQESVVLGTSSQSDTLTYQYDAVGQVVELGQDASETGGRSLSFDYDANGNLRSLGLPGASGGTATHVFTYNSVNLGDAYLPPLHDTIESGKMIPSYDRDGRLKQVLFPSAATAQSNSRKIDYTYEAGRLKKITTPEGITGFTYRPGGLFDTVTRDGRTLTYEFDGEFQTEKFGWIQNIALRTLRYQYNNDFQLERFDFGGLHESYDYDGDGLLTKAGIFTLTRDPDNGVVDSVQHLQSTTVLASVEPALNGFGELDTVLYKVNGATRGSFDLCYDLCGDPGFDNSGRITEKTETFAGQTVTYTYGYDELGRLKTVKHGGVTKESYTYDKNGNRLTEVNALRSVNRSYVHDNEDRLISAGSVIYDFDRDGYLTTRTDGSAVTTYDYSTLGELLAVELPNGTDVTYDHDPLGRRISKSVNGVIVERYLWEGRTKLLAIYGIVDNQERVLQRFEYAGGRMPVSMLKRNGSTDDRYYLLYDQVGTLRAITDSSGATVKHITYDSFGNILTDSNPSFTIPFGFAGGLHDRDTGLVRFGYRDYDPETGRWTAKDPILFEGDTSNLYEYCLNDPTSCVDIDGESPTLITGAIGAVGGALIGGGVAWYNGGSWGDIAAGAGSGALTGGLTGATLGAAGGALFAGGRVAVSGIAAARTAGAAGEAAVRSGTLIGLKQAIRVNGKKYVPDGINWATNVLSEIKNVSSLSYTKQLRAFCEYAKKENLRFDLFVRENTRLSRPLLEAIDEGSITLKFIPK